MEYKDLETLWKQYDEKLNSLESINKKLLKETLLQKPQRKLNWIEYGSAYKLFFMPFALWLVLHYTLKNVSWQAILGSALFLAVLAFAFVGQLKIYLISRKVDLNSDSVAQSLGKVLRLQKIAEIFRKYLILYFPVAFLGIALFAGFFKTINPVVVGVMCVLFYLFGAWKATTYKKKLATLEKDIMELEGCEEK